MQGTVGRGSDHRMELKADDMLKLEKAFFKNLQRDNCEYARLGLTANAPSGTRMLRATSWTSSEPSQKATRMNRGAGAANNGHMPPRCTAA